MQVRDGLRAPARRAVELLDPDRVLERVVVGPMAGVASLVARGLLGERLLSGLLERRPAWLVDRTARAAQRFGQAGFLQGYVASMLAGALLVVLVLTLGEAFRS